jgi:hypothetical protein
VAGLLVRAVTHVGVGGKALELTAVTAVDTAGLSPGLLLVRGEKGRARSGRARGKKRRAFGWNPNRCDTPRRDGTPRAGNAPNAARDADGGSAPTRVVSFDSRGTRRDRQRASFGDAEWERPGTGARTNLDGDLAVALVAPEGSSALLHDLVLDEGGHHGS